MKQVLFVDRRDSRLDVDRERLLVFSDSLPKPLSVAFSLLSTVVISAKTTLSSQVLLACAKFDVAVVVLNPRDADFSAQFLPPSAKVVQRKLQQFHVVSDEVLCLRFSKWLVQEQMLKQLRLLKYWYRQQYLTETLFKQYVERIKSLYLQVDDVHSIASLRGLEGAAAREIFSALECFAPKWCAFHGRNRRPPQDPINVVLSLSFSLLYGECSRALLMHSFEPLLGFYHEPTHGRPSLSCDLAERVRFDVLQWAVNLFLSGTLHTKHFSYSEQYPCVLNKEGRKIFYPLWELQLRVWKRFLRQNVREWVARIDVLTLEMQNAN